MPDDSTYHKYYDALQNAYGQNGTVEKGSFTLGFDDFKTKLANQSYAQRIYGALQDAYGTNGKAEKDAFTLPFDSFYTKLTGPSHNTTPQAATPYSAEPFKGTSIPLVNAPLPEGQPPPTVDNSAPLQSAANDLTKLFNDNKDAAIHKSLLNDFQTQRLKIGNDLQNGITDAATYKQQQDQLTGQMVNPQPLINQINQDMADEHGIGPKTRRVISQIAKTNPEVGNKIKSSLYSVDALSRPTTDPQLADRIKDNAAKIQSGDLDYDVHTGQLQKPENIVQSAVNGWNQKTKALDDYSVFSNASPEQAIQELESRRAQYDPNTPVPVPGSIGGRLAEGLASQPLKGLIAGKVAGTATGFIPGAEEFAPAVDKFVSAAVSSNDFRKMTYANSLQKYYNQMRDKGIPSNEAYDKANKQATQESYIDAASNAAMMYAGGSIGETKLPTLSNGFKSAVVKGAQEAMKVGGEASAIGGIQGGAQAIKNQLAQAKGLSSGETPWSAVENGVFTTLGIGLLSKAAGSLTEATKAKVLQGLSKLPPEKVNAELGQQIIDGRISPDEAVKAKAEIDNHSTIDQSLPANLSEDTKAKIAVHVNQRNILEDQLENLDKAYHPAIKEQIKNLNERILDLTGQDKGIPESNEETPFLNPKTQDHGEETQGNAQTEGQITEPEGGNQNAAGATFLESRHADTVDDEKGLVSGPNDNPLSKEGRRDANDLAKDVEDKGVTKVITSDLERSKETGNTVAEKVGATVEHRPELNTWDIGDFDKAPDEEFKKAQTYFVEHPDATEFEGKKINESFNQYKDRIIKARTDLENEPSSTLVVNHSNNMMLWDAYVKNGHQWNEQAAKDYLSAKTPEPATLQNKEVSYPKVTNIKLKANALQERRPEEVLQREPGNDGETGGERGRVEQSQQGNEPSGESQPSAEPAAVPETEASPNQEASTNVVPPEKGDDWPFVEEPEDSEATSIRNAVTAQKIEEYGLMPAMRAAKREFGTVWDEAVKKINDGYDVVKRLIEPLSKKPRPLTDTENAMLLYHQNVKESQLANASKELDRARLAGDRGAQNEWYTTRAKLLDDLQKIYDVDKSVGTLNARGLASRKMMADRRFSLVNMMIESQASAGEDRLTEEQLAQVQKMHDDIKQTKEAYEKTIDDLKKENAALLAERAFRKDRLGVESEQKTSARKEKVAKIKDALSSNVKELKDILKQQRGKLSANPIPVEALPVLAKMAKNVLHLGVVGFENIVDHVYEAIKDEFSGLNKQHVRDALVAASDKTKTEAFSNGSMDALYEFRKSGKGDSQVGDLYRDMVAKRADYNKAVDKYESGLKQAEEKQRNVFQKGLDVAVKWERGFKLSNPVTLAKLAQAALIRMAQTPVESSVGGLYSAVLPKLAARAEGEGGINVRATASAIKTAYMHTLTDVGALFKKGGGGKGELDYAFGKTGNLPPEAIDFFGHLHSAIKAPVKRFAFERSLEKRLQKNINNGVDVTDPAVATSILNSAYKDANRAIFMQDNAVSRSYQNFIANLERDTKNPNFSKSTAAVAKFLMPFVKVPTNIVGETSQHVAGLPIAGGQALYYAFEKGLSNLTPDEADSILRNMKKGTIGAGALLLGYFHPKDFGGYYMPNDKKKPKDLKPGEMKLFGKRIPLWALEAPVFQAMQVGATIRRMSEVKEGGEKAGLVSGIANGLLGMVGKEPLLEEPANLLGAVMKPGQERNYFISSLAKSTMDPALIDFLAKLTDPGDKRSVAEKLIYPDETRQADKKHGLAKQVVQTVETGIPGLREKVPLKKKQ